MEKWSVINHYRKILNQEEGSIKKFGKVKIALVYPNKYDIAIQNLGFQHVYKRFNEIEDVVCERFVLDYIEDNLSIESQKFIREFDIIALSINFEEDILRFIQFLNSERIPVFKEERGEFYPPIIAGGALAFINPAILTDIVDVILLGDIDPILNKTKDIFREYSKKEEFIERLLTFDFAISKEKYPGKIALREKNEIISSVIITGLGEFANEYLVELSSGCKYSCRFCTATFAYRPFRIFDYNLVKKDIVHYRFSDNIGLISAAFGDLPGINHLLKEFMDYNLKVSVSSLRADTLTKEIISSLKSLGVRSITIAEETCSPNLKKLINKEIDEDTVLSVANMIAKEGIENLKLYYMIGLPGETLEDVALIVKRIENIAKIFLNTQKEFYNRLGRIRVSINIFIPKPNTPMQYFGIDNKSSLNKKINLLKSGLGKIPNVKYDIMNYSNALLQSYLSRAEDDIREFYKSYLNNNFRVKKALKDIDAMKKAEQFFDENYTFIWEKMVIPNFDREIIKREFLKCKEILKNYY
ncbi:radical SAM protein [Deferribacter thermophilus]|uniref:radical SAM protein n=1 Tax=Deferribacter thermophilus TaxID=53573 RepID=UPI003C1E300D